ncbi:hypothetical protein ACLI1A_03190 [Flavobacterium sp. RHBU_3]|uniref:hypothetical protein n=1 Tax=Flavobacterium sp. RHBU_3 TaxID=3391184 RepID=UPI003984CC5F
MKYFVVIALLFFNLGNACSCIGKSKIKPEIKASSLIVSGVIIGSKMMQDHSNNYTSSFMEYSVLVQKVFKGSISNDTIKIYTGVGKGDCGYRFVIGQKYIIYANIPTEYKYSPLTDTEYFYTDICMRTMSYTVDEEKKIKRYTKT